MLPVLFMAHFREKFKSERGFLMKEKVLAVCKSVDSSVDFSSTRLIEDGLIDSVTLVSIVTELMDEFGIEIPYEDIIPENFNSIDAMVELVKRYV